MKKTRFQQAKEACRTLKANALAALGDGGEDFAGLARDVNQRVALDDRALTLAMAGEYSVGKSSLIKALTGEDVPVGAGVTTAKVAKYKYQDLVLVDMPGTLSGQMEHDEIAVRAMAEADLILFVVSNELFNRESLPYFRLASEKLAKKHQMLLVVNKFDRFNLAGRTPEQAVHFIGGVLADEIRPLAIREFGPVVVSAREYLAASDTSDPQKRERLYADSRFHTLVEAIDDVTAERGVLAQQVLPLQKLLEILEEAVTLALADDGSRSRAEALVRRRMFALKESRGLAKSEFRKLRDRARTGFLKPAETLLKLMDNKTGEQEMDAAAHVVERDLEYVVKDVGDQLSALCESLVADLTTRLEEIDASALASQVRAEIDISLERADVGEIKEGMSAKQRKSLATALKKTADLIHKNAKTVADALGRVYKFFGGKFKPWGKVKLGSWVEKAGKVLGPLAVLTEAYMSYRDEQHKAQAETRLRTMRAELRAQFADAASQFDTVLREQEDQVVAELYDKPLANELQVAQQIVAGAKGRAQLAERLTTIVNEIRRRIEEMAS